MIDPTTTPYQLAELLGTTYSRLSYVLYKLQPERFYDIFTIKKKNGGVRTIAAPKRRLRKMQMIMASLLEHMYKPSSAATAFIKSKGLIDNARPHTSKSLVFNLDLEDFFGSIHFGRVKGLLCAKPYSLREDTAKLIATLCCYKKKIPQGAPTSPILSNMVAAQLDRKLSLLAKRNLAYYTRYADDITFSFRNLNHEGVCVEVNGVYQPSKPLVDIINGCGFTINESKTRGATSKSRQVVTGLKVNKKVNVDRRYVRTTKAMMHDISIDEDAANKKFWKKRPDKEGTYLKDVVAGRISYIRMIKGVESSVYEMLAHKFNTLPIDQKLAFDPSPLREDYTKNRVLGSKKYLSNCMWIISFDGIEGATFDDELVQGSAFMIAGQRIITCAHTFEKASDLTSCYIFQAHDHSKKYEMSIKEICKTRDYVELEFKEKPKRKFTTLEVYSNQSLHTGYELSLVGFPEYLASQTCATIIGAKVISSVIKSTFKLYEVDAEVVAGLSGGAVVNRYCQVVGIVTQGKSVSHNKDTAEYSIEGKSLFLGSENFL